MAQILTLEDSGDRGGAGIAVRGGLYCPIMWLPALSRPVEP